MSHTDPEYWYCLKHHAVEPREGSKNADRLGPYPAEASRALEKVEERNEEWENDPAWNDSEDDAGDDPRGDEDVDRS